MLTLLSRQWMDIMSGMIFIRPPRFLAVYRRLFSQGGPGGAGYWSAANNEQLDLRMDKLTGCPDEALLAIAEIAALASWKKSEAAQGTLSMRELIRRGDQIEQALRQRPARNYAESPTTDTVPSGMAAAAGAGMIHDIAGPDEATRLRVAQIYRETAVLYLHTVLSDSHPGEYAPRCVPCDQPLTRRAPWPTGVAEIGKSINNLLDHFQQFPPSEFDRAVVLPLVLTGSMSADPLFREIIRGRCNLHQDAYFGGTIAQARHVVDQMCHRRDTLNSQRTGIAVDWRDVVRERWSSLFLI